MTLPYAEIILKKGKEKSIENFHPWIFSGAVAQKPETLKDGDPVHVLSAGKEFLATGIFHYSSIAVRILSFRKELLDENFWIEKIKNALALRQALQLYNNNATNAYRLIHGEGDGISGLIIDVYGKHVVMQAHVQGIFNFRKE
ncbi:MAG: class I SAM-dependent rRNA methyltransferase, partial [Bacteroidetes bacterium]|nr:class I SAM-dependent rRNA methyltransferase [Bacteroidota bacterium]